MKRRLLVQLLTGAGVLAVLVGTAPAQVEVHVKIGRESPPATFDIQKATDLIGKTVTNPQNQKLGEVKDLAVDPDRGRIAYAVLSFDDSLGLGSKWFAIPWTSFALRDSSFLLNADKATLSTAQGFDKDNWPDMADMRWATAIHAHYGQKPYWEETRTEPRLAGHEEESDARRTHRMVRASEVLDMDVVNQGGNELGEIENLGVDVNHNRVAYAVVGSNGFLDLGETLFAVPWDAFQVKGQKGPLLLNVDKATLENSPRFPKGRWPASQDRAFLESVYSYYKVAPYWPAGEQKDNDKD